MGQPISTLWLLHPVCCMARFPSSPRVMCLPFEPLARPELRCCRGQTTPSGLRTQWRLEQKCLPYVPELTSWATVHEKLSHTASQIFPAFYGNETYIIAFTTAHHLTLTWNSRIQSTRTHTVILFLMSLFNIIVLLASRSVPIKISDISHASYTYYPPHPHSLDCHDTRIWHRLQIVKSVTTTRRMPYALHTGIQGSKIYRLS